MHLENSVQQKIIRDLIHVEKASFNQLWKKKGDSNKFAYHLNRLINLGLIKKKSGHYTLTRLGKTFIAFLDSTTGSALSMPTLAYVCIIKKGRQYVCHERTKAPFRGYWSFVSGTLQFGSAIDAQVATDARTQTGLVLHDVKHKGIEEIRTLEDNEILYHHLLLIYTAKVKKGTLRVTLPGKRQQWMTEKEFLSAKTFPPIAVHELLDNNNTFVIASGERYMKQGQFTGSATQRLFTF
ncbi:hypothetical protein GF342_05705 [Candidatus Woesearchaeota archaeon]|nr:hypothetical protein [Candidatus Woesearchaeota archaeon]